MAWGEASARRRAERSVSGELLVWALFCLAAVLAVQAGLSTGFFDTDYFWHLETGRWIVEQGRLPEGDVFSHSFQGEPWVLHEWLAQLLLFAAFALGGQATLLLAAALCAGSALYLAYRLADGLLEKPLVSLLLTLFMAGGLLNFVSPRPQVFSFLLFALWLTVIWRARYDGRLKPLAALPVIMLLWVNLHGGYVIGLAVLASYLLFDWLSSRYGAAGGETPRPGYLRALALALLASLLVVPVNPDGLERFIYPFQVMTMTANEGIAEWNSFDFHVTKAKWILLGLFTYLLLSMGAGRRPGLSEWAVPLATLAAALTSARHAPFAVLVMVPYAALALSRNPGFAAWREAEGKGDVLAPLLIKARWAGALAAVIALLPLSMNPRYWDRMAAVTPDDLVRVIEERELQGPLFNAYGIGGYLIHALGPDHPVLIDGRADLYGDAFVNEVNRATAGGEGWRATLDRYDAQYLVLYRDSALAALLDMDGDFGLVCESVAFSLFVRLDGPNGRFGDPAARRGEEIDRPCEDSLSG